MTARRRTIALFSVIVLAILGALGYGVARMQQGGFGPWAFALSWQQMDRSLETQVITATAVELEVLPAQRRISGEATVTVASPGGDGSEVFLLLNPGLRIDTVTCGEERLRVNRHRERHRISLPTDTTACTLRIRYQGWPIAANGSTLVLEPEEILLDKLQFWYPVDLKSFGAFSAGVTVPEDFDVVWSGTLKENRVAAGRRHVQWAEARPILAAGLALGKYVRHSRIQGSIRCNVFGKALDGKGADAYLAALGDAYNYLRSKLGTDNFAQLNLVLSDHLQETDHGGGPLLFAAPETYPETDRLFVSLARHVARNWWGESVSGRWFSARPEAGEWLASGMAEYSAWQALRSVKGRRAYLRFIETRSCPPQNSAPMKTANLGWRLRSAAGYAPSLNPVRGAFAATILATYAGTDAFDQACKNFMSVHRYTTVSFGALLHEITLASEVPLDELVRVWFDRPGTFDYRIANVILDESRVHVTIENVGDIPAYVPMKLGLVTETGYYAHDVMPGVNSDTVSFAIEGTLKRVVLDPEFALGDMGRANNSWPPTEWPEALAVGPNGRIALLGRLDWGEGAEARMTVFSRMDKAPEYALHVGANAPHWMRWDSAGRQLAMAGAQTGSWRQGRWSPAPAGHQVPLGWAGNQFMTWDIEKPWTLAGDFSEVARGHDSETCIAFDSTRGDVAVVNSTGRLMLQKRGEPGAILLREGVYPAGALAWRAGRQALLYFEQAGDLVSLSVDEELRTVLLHRNYRVDRSRISEEGRYVAWIDPAGLLRAVEPDAGEPAYISLPGEIVDFAWEGEEALVALVAAIPRRLPMRYHAEYTLWRIPVSTWQGVQLPYDSEQFARMPKGDSYRLPPSNALK